MPMDKILNQEEIDALFRAARGEKGKDSSRSQSVTPANFRHASQITRDQVRSVSMLHETFARNLTHSLGAYLRIIFEVNLVSVEQLSYAEFLQRIPDISYVASVALLPVGAAAAVQIDLPLAFPIIDLLLGGQGKAETQIRDITEIEEQILESVVKVIARELQITWQPLLDLEFAFDQRQPLTQILRLMPPNEKILSLSFEIRMPEVRGNLNVVFPAVVSNALLRKLSESWVYQRRQGAADARPYLQEQLLKSRFHLELSLPASGISIGQLLQLEPGHVLMLQQRADQPAVLSVAGRQMFAAFPVRSGNRRAAQIERQIPVPKPREGESR